MDLLNLCTLIFLLHIPFPIFAQSIHDIFELYSSTGTISRNSSVGTALVFDSPLRISKQAVGPVSLSLPEPSVAAIFEVSPKTVEPGHLFVVKLAGQIPHGVNSINITIRASIGSENKIMEHLRVLTVQFEGAESGGGSAALPEMPRLHAHELQINLTSHQQLRPNELLGQVEVQNAAVTNLNSFAYRLVGKLSKWFKVTTAQQSVNRKHLEVRLADDCLKEACEFDQLKMVGSPPLILQILPVKNLSIPSSFYLIHVNQQSLLETVPVVFKNREVKVNVTENSRSFYPLLRLEINHAASGAIQPNFTFQLQPMQRSSIFAIHPLTGVLTIKKSEELNLQKLGGQDEIGLVAQLVDEKRRVVDEAQIKIKIKPVSKPKDDSLSKELLKFEQPIYAFAVGPGVEELGRIHVSQSSPSVIYGISEGGASYFSINPQTGQLFYRGPLEKNTKNYTLKAIATEKETDRVDTTSIQILVAGIGSTPPQFSSKVEIVEIDDDSTPERIVHTVAAMDFDADARLVYRVVEANCSTVLGQPVDGPSCKELFRFANGGLRNGSLSTSKLLNKEELTLEEDLIHNKILAVAVVHLNISVSDSNHPLEPPAYAILILRIKPKTPKQKQLLNEDQMSRKFYPLPTDRLIRVSDNIPPNSYVYTFTMSPMVNGDLNHTNIGYSLVHKQKHFAVDSQSGILTCTASLKGVGRENVSVAAKHLDTDQLIDMVTLTVEVESCENSLPEFRQSFYQFNASLADWSDKHQLKIGQVEAEHKEGLPLKYDIVHPSNGDAQPPQLSQQPFTIDSKGIIMLNAKNVSSQHPDNNFFVRATNSNHKSVMTPVFVKLAQTSDHLLPTFGHAPTSVLVMENAPVGAFVADLQVKHSNKVQLLADSPSNATSNRLVAALVVNKNGMVRTFAPLSGFKDGEYRLELMAENGVQKVGKELVINMVSTSKCMPEFLPSQQLVFNVSTMSSQETVIGRVQAQITDNCELIYALESASQPLPIDINPESGVLSTNSQLWSHSHGERLPLIIVARSGHLFTRIVVEIRLQPASKESLPKPVFLQSLLLVEMREDAPLNSTVGRVKALGQLPVYYYLPVHHSLFSVHPKTGRIYTTQLLDHESEINKFDLKIYASYENPTEFWEKEGEEFAKVEVNVLDVNDNDPRFDQSTYEVVVEADSLVGTVVGQVNAFDVDSSTDSLAYSLEATQFLYRNTSKSIVKSPFAVDPLTGNIHLRSSVKDMVGGVYNLSISVRDGHNSDTSRTSSTSALIWLCDGQSDIVSVLLAENPRRLTSAKLREYLRIMSEASTAKVLLHEVRYRTLPSDATVMRDFTVLRLLYVDPKTWEVISPSEAEKMIREIKMPEVMTMEMRAFASTSFNALGAGTNAQAKKTTEDSSLLSSLFLALAIFGVLLITILALLGVILCYHRRQFLRQREFMRNEKIARSTLNTATSVSSTLRQLGLQSNYTAHYPAYEHSVDSMWDQRPAVEYYTIQEKKICL